MSAQSSESHINMTSAIISKAQKKTVRNLHMRQHATRSPAFDSSVCSSILLLSLLLLLLLSLLISLFLLLHSSAWHARDKTQRYRSAHRIKTVGCLQFLLWLYIRLKLFLSSKWGGLSGLPRLAARSQYFAACVTAADCLQFLVCGLIYF